MAGRGSKLFGSIIEILMEQIPDPQARQNIYVPIIITMIENDWHIEVDFIGRDAAYDNALNSLDKIDD